MPYRVRYHKAAKTELEKCRTLYDRRVFSNKLNKWLSALAAEAESKQWTLSTDLESLFGSLDEAEELAKQWPAAWRRFWDAGFRAKLKAAYLALSGRSPYQARSAVETFPIFQVSVEVTALYLVDHSTGEVIFMAFDGLPLQDYD